jgi:hypothetical protein
MNRARSTPKSKLSNFPATPSEVYTAVYNAVIPPPILTYALQSSFSGQKSRAFGQSPQKLKNAVVRHISGAFSITPNRTTPPTNGWESYP